MFEEIPDSHFGLNYDPSHMIWQQMDEVRPIEEFRSRLYHVHAKDAAAGRDAGWRSHEGGHHRRPTRRD